MDLTLTTKGKLSAITKAHTGSLKAALAAGSLFEIVHGLQHVTRPTSQKQGIQELLEQYPCREVLLPHDNPLSLIPDPSIHLLAPVGQTARPSLLKPATVVGIRAVALAPGVRTTQLWGARAGRLIQD